MGNGVRATEAAAGLRSRGIGQRMDARLRRLDLLQRSGAVRRLVDVGTRGVKIDPIPWYLGEDHRTVLVSNYPSVSQTLRALIKMGCRLPGDGYRLKGIGRPDVVTNASALLKALGVDNLIFPVYKDDAGAYRLHKQVVKQVLEYLEGEGNVLWMSITGTTRGNGLLETDVRTGAALFSTGRGVPIVPMGLVTKQVKGKPRVVRVRFGEPIPPPPMDELSDFDKTDLLVDLSRLALCRTASLLPPGQRGDFEQVEEKLREIEARLAARYS
ncbi:MAG TPA: hypothetical protein VM075_06170 [Anaerolineae bacterium]|nr:hypothetical protein [Anaerolineae bacterium]